LPPLGVNGEKVLKERVRRVKWKKKVAPGKKK